MDAYEALKYDATHAEPEVILAEARRRWAAGQSIRGLPRPYDAPAAAWYSIQRRPLAGGDQAVHLYMRWRIAERAGGPRCRSLGRLA